ncbi:MAG TPA: hypothetical protein VN914_15050 [Polyangia bacterium]|nr:hypothetical protein [Polyangia bacterium]
MRVGALALVVSVVGLPLVAEANNVFIEGEEVRDEFSGLMTSPMLVKDDNLASLGSYITVTPGNDSKNAAPGEEGLVSLPFEVSNDGNYRIWGRVIAPNDGDDSFWVRIPGKTGQIKWNEIPLGSSWHWALVKPEGSSNPTSVSLQAGVQYRIEFAYREDGTKLDAIYITDDGLFNPAAPLPAPAPPATIQTMAGNGSTMLVQWSDVSGATGYIVERGDFSGDVSVPVASTTGHRLTLPVVSPEENCFRVRSIFPSGNSALSSQSCGGIQFDGRRRVDLFAISSPMVFQDGGLGVTPGLNSKDVAPAKGKVRRDFQLGNSQTLFVWADVFAPNDGGDSFWLRMDNGAWIKWNEIPLGGVCAIARNSDNNNALVSFNLGPGQHFLEFSYREDGALFTNQVVMTTGSQAPPCDD